RRLAERSPRRQYLPLVYLRRDGPLRQRHRPCLSEGLPPTAPARRARLLPPFELHRHAVDRFPPERSLAQLHVEGAVRALLPQGGPAGAPGAGHRLEPPETRLLDPVRAAEVARSEVIHTGSRTAGRASRAPSGWGTARH